MIPMNIDQTDYRAFRGVINSDAMLDATIEWIRSNLTPEQVFDTNSLETYARDWAFDNGYTFSADDDD